VKKPKIKHDEKTCFRCRLHALTHELDPKKQNLNEIQYLDEIRFILVSLAECAGTILSQMEDKEKLLFMNAVMNFHDDAIDEDQEECDGATKH
jgi:hypothetical protein